MKKKNIVIEVEGGVVQNIHYIYFFLGDIQYSVLDWDMPNGIMFRQAGLSGTLAESFANRIRKGESRQDIGEKAISILLGGDNDNL